MSAEAVTAPRGLAGVYFKLSATALLWAATMVAARYASGSVTPVAGAWVRYLAAVALLVPLTVHREGGFPPLDRRQLGWTIGLGITGVVLFNVFFFLALRSIPASRGTVIMALNPAMMVIALALLFGQRPGVFGFAGVVLVLAGVWTVLSEGDVASIFSNITAGDLAMIGACASWTAYGLIARFAIRGLTPLAATAYASLWGFLILTALALPDLLSADWRAMSPGAIAAMVYMGLFGTALAFIWYTEGLIRIGPARATVFMNLTPVFSVVLAAVLLGERIGASMIAGGLMTVAGVALTNRTGKR